VPCVRLRSDAERQKVRPRRRAVRAGHRTDDIRQDGHRRGCPVSSRLGYVPRWCGG